jgi:hypothetical protein
MKYIVTCFLQLVFNFSKFLVFKLTYLLNCWWFCDFDPFTEHFWAPGCYFEPFVAKLKHLDNMEYLKYIINCFLQLAFNFSQFLDFKLTYLLNYWWFCDFDPFTEHFWAPKCYFEPFEAKLLFFYNIVYIKYIVACFLQLVFNFSQFLVFKLTYLLNCWWFCDFDPFTEHFWPPGCYFEPFVAKLKHLDNIEYLKYIINCFLQLAFNFSQFLDFKLTYLLNYW